MHTAATPACAASELLGRRLASYALLSLADLAALHRLKAGEESHIGGDELAAAGVRLVAAGLLAETRLLSDGRRQIIALKLPGDLIREPVAPSHAIVALHPSRTIDGSAALAFLDSRRRDEPLHQAWQLAMRHEQRCLLDQIVRLGRLSAHERMAHLLLELHERLCRVGLATARGFQLRLTQDILADVLGLSVVHVNRVMQQLRREGLLTYRSGLYTLPDRAALARVAEYPLALQDLEHAGLRKAG